MNEDLIWLDGNLDGLDDEENDLEWSEECEYYSDGECLQMGAPCPARGNSASFSCLLDEDMGMGPEMLEAS